MSLLDAIINDLKRSFLSFKTRWLESELQYLDQQIKKQEKVIAECEVKIAASKNCSR